MINRSKKRKLSESEPLLSDFNDKSVRSISNLIFNNTIEFIGLLRTDGTLLDANQSSLDFVGATLADVKGKPFWKTPWWAKDAEGCAKLRAGIPLAAQGEFIRFEAKHHGKNGEEISVDFSLKPVTDENGKVILIIPEGRDITERIALEGTLQKAYDELEIRVQERTARLEQSNAELLSEIEQRKEAEANLRKSEEKQSGILDSIPAHIAVLDKKGNIINVNKSWTDFTLANGGEKHLAKTGVGVNYLEFCYKAVNSPESFLAAEGIKEVLSGKRIHFTLEYPCHSDTANRWFLLTVTPFGFSEGGAVVTHINITNRKAAEEKLRRSEERLRLVLDASKIGFWDYDLFTEKTEWSPENCRIFGIDKFDGVSETFWKMVDSRDRERIKKEFEKVIETGGFYDVEFRIARPDGKSRWVKGLGHCKYDSDGRPLRFLGTNADITERKKMETTLAASEEKYRYLFDKNPLPVVVADDETSRILEVNETMIKHYGYSRDEFLKMSVEDLIFEKDIRKFRDSVKVSANEKFFSVSIRHRRKNKRIIQVEVTQYRFFLEGRPVRIAIVQDVTERNQLVAAMLQEHEEKVGILESITDAFAALNRDFHYTYVNSAGEKLLRKQASELIGKCIWDVFPDSVESKAFEEYKRVLQTGEASAFEMYYEPFETWLEIRAYPTPSGLSIYWRDITERRQLEAKLARSAQLALIGELAAGLAHEIKNPLAGIKGVIDIMLQRRSAESEMSGEKEILNNVRHEIERIDGTVRALLQHTRPKSLQIKPSSLIETVKRASQIAYHQTGIRHSFCTKIPTELEFPKTELIIPHDSARIEDAVLNLILNARDAIGENPDGRIKVRVSQTLSKKSNETEAVIEVSDNGCGIELNKLERIFTPFYTTKEDGTGLGLASVKRIVRAHGGDCEAHSIVGKGTTMTIRLPF